MQIPAVHGRAFPASDTGDSSAVGLLNPAFVRPFFGDEHPRGKQVLMGQARLRPVEIVGIVGDTLQTSLTAPPPALFYMPFRRFPFWITTFVVRTRIDPEGLMTTLRREVSAIAPGVPVLAAGPLDTFVGRSFAASKRRALVLHMLSGLALLLAAVGRYRSLS